MAHERSKKAENFQRAVANFFKRLGRGGTTDQRGKLVQGSSSRRLAAGAKGQSLPEIKQTKSAARVLPKGFDPVAIERLLASKRGHIDEGTRLGASLPPGFDPVKVQRLIDAQNGPSIPVTAAPELDAPMLGGGGNPYAEYEQLLRERANRPPIDLGDYMRPFDEAEQQTNTQASAAQAAISEAGAALQQKLAQLKADYDTQAQGVNGAIQGNIAGASQSAQAAVDPVLADLLAHGVDPSKLAQTGAVAQQQIAQQGTNQATLAQRLAQVAAGGQADRAASGQLMTSGAQGTLATNKAGALSKIGQGRADAKLQYEQDRSKQEDAILQQKLEFAKWQAQRADELEERAYQRSREKAELDPHDGYTSKREQFLVRLGSPGSKTPRADEFMRKLIQNAPDEETLDLAINELEGSKEAQERVKREFGLDAKALARRLRKEYQDDTAVKRTTLVKPSLSDLRSR